MCKYLIKFTSKKKYANDLLNGKLYMHSARDYHKLEIEKGAGQGDLAEGAFFNNAQIYRFNDYPLFCMYSVETDDIIDKTISIPYRLVNDFECEKGYLILIDYNCFIEDIKSCNTNGFSLYAGRVL